MPQEIPLPEKTPQQIREEMEAEAKKHKEEFEKAEAARKVEESAEVARKVKEAEEAADKKAIEDAALAKALEESAKISNANEAKYKNKIMPPVFDANIQIFKVRKRVDLGDWSYHPEDFIFIENHPHLKNRTLRLLFEQKYLSYPTQEEFVKLLSDPKAKEDTLAKAVKTKQTELELDKKNQEEVARKAKEEADKRKKNGRESWATSHGQGVLGQK